MLSKKLEDTAEFICDEILSKKVHPEDQARLIDALSGLLKVMFSRELFSRQFESSSSYKNRR